MQLQGRRISAVTDGDHAAQRGHLLRYHLSSRYMSQQFYRSQGMDHEDAMSGDDLQRIDDLR